jgi:hypothetical protein
LPTRKSVQGCWSAICQFLADLPRRLPMNTRIREARRSSCRKREIEGLVLSNDIVSPLKLRNCRASVAF